MPDSSQPRRSDAPAALFTGALVAAVYSLIFGYAYGGGDHDDLLPPVLARLEPGLFSLDPYVSSQLDGVTVRTAFQTLLVGLGGVIPLHTAVGALHVLVLVATGAGVFLLARSLRAGRTASAVAALIACVGLQNATIGGNAVVYPLLTPEGLAWALLLPAMALFVQRKRKWAAVLVGLATWFHPLAGGLTLIALALVAAMEVAQKREGLRDLIGFTVLSGVIALPLVLPALLYQSAEAGARLPDGLDPFTLYAVLRFPHHYLPTETAALRIGFFVSLAVLGASGYAIARTTSRPPDVRFPVRFAIVATALMLVASVGIYAFDSLALARAQTFKLTVLLNVLASIGVGVGLLALSPRSVRRGLDRALRKKTRALLLLTLVGVGLSVWTATMPASRHAGQASDWVAQNTSRDAVFVVPPTLSDFRVPARRSVIVTWKSVPFRADQAADWWTRLMTVAPLSSVPTDGEDLAGQFRSAFARQDDDHLRSLVAAYGATHALLPNSMETEFPVLFEGSSWKVVRLS